MRRRAACVLPLLVGAGVCGVGTATAAPAQPGCAYTLAQPVVTQVSGTPMVTTTVTVAACRQSNAMLQVACLELKGAGAAPLCVSSEGPAAAQVFFAPYRPGATYVASGRGCAVAGSPTVSVCNAVGPVTVTL
ncbi:MULTISPECIES: hypothetical protein [Mycobacteriaceae]|uniref:hypothetical protein n=1 Tax=Mycobacteriaceae TaxID=1762 RepID=UPI001F374ED8|nr:MULTISPECIES: hypothetical protein [Mycobacteriaceae]